MVLLITKGVTEQTCAYTEILPMEEPDQRCTLPGSGPWSRWVTQWSKSRSPNIRPSAPSTHQRLLHRGQVVPQRYITKGKETRKLCITAWSTARVYYILSSIPVSLVTRAVVCQDLLHYFLWKCRQRHIRYSAVEKFCFTWAERMFLIPKWDFCMHPHTHPDAASAVLHAWVSCHVRSA